MDLHRNQTGSALTSVAWLDQHHAIKAKQRTALVSELAFQPGEHVLDFGCATGNWSFLVGDQVGPNGLVYGIDADSRAIGVARDRNLARSHVRNIEFTCDTHPPDHQKFDTVLLFNVLSYVEEPAELVERLIECLKPGGRVILKDTDIGSNFYWPVPPDLYGRVLASILQPGRRLVDGYDPSFARHLPALVNRQDGFKISTFSQNIFLAGRLSEIERDYVKGNVQITAALLDDFSLRSSWLELFSDRNPRSVFNDAGFIFSMNEFVFQLKEF